MSTSVALRLHGKLFLGTYTVAQHFITVSCGSVRKTAVLWDMRPKPMARMLLWQIAREQRGQPSPHA